MKPPYKIYERTFKENAVKLSYEKDYCQIPELAKELEIVPSLIRRWRKEFEQFGTGSFPGIGGIKLNGEKKSYKYEKKIYDYNFKENAVNLSYGLDSRQFSKLEKELGISQHLLSKWRKEYKEFGTGSFRGCGNARVHPEKEKVIELEKKLKIAELNYEILKKGGQYLFQDDEMIYKFIEDNEQIYTAKRIAIALGIGEGRYQRWKKRMKNVSKTQRRVLFLKKVIASTFYNAKQRYGSPRISKELENQGIKISKGQVANYMKQLGLRCIRTRRYKVTTDSSHNCYVVPNLLNRQFIVDEPAKVWVSDITYIQTLKGFLYLTIILDLFDRKIIGWHLSTGLSSRETAFPAWSMACKNRKITKELLFHSDRGVQYANKRFTRMLHANKFVRRSMSRKANTIDNVVAESFFKTLKVELIHRINILTRKEMKVEIFEFIENWYNKERLHSTLNYKTIAEFDRLNNVK